MIFIILGLWSMQLSVDSLDLGPDLESVSRPFHNFCLSRLPDHTKWPELYQALVCGQTPKAGEIRQWFQLTGLYHLLVVSGSHLMFVASWFAPLRRLKWGRKFILIGLGIYVLMCQAQPPVARAWATLALGGFIRARRWNWSPAQISIATSSLCLALFPNWVLSLSFWLSWLASMACSFLRRSSSLERAFFMQVAMLPAFYSVSGGHPIVFVCNWLLAPVLEHGLLPLCLATIGLPALTSIVDEIWRGLLMVLETLAHFVSAPGHFNLSVFWLSAYTIGLNFIWMGLETWGRRRPVGLR